MKNIIVAAIALAFCISSTFAQTGKENIIIHRINYYLTQIDKAGFNGAVLVEFNSEKKVSRGFGDRDKEKQLKNSPSAIFDIGSVTKQFTAAAILKLEMQGKISTEDKISKYFQNIPPDKENITIHDLLRHQSGLISNVGKDFEETGEEEFLDKVMTSKLRFETGTRFSYSNIGYSLLGMIIEKVSGKSYETYLYENLWKPAEMEMTGYVRPQFDANLIAVGYDEEDNAWGKPNEKNWDKTAPYWHLKANGGILSTTEDLYKWHRALMTEHVLSKEAKNKLYHPQLRPEETEQSYYAYGWDISKTPRNTTSVWHNGSNHIFYADFLRFIDEGVTFIMLSNKSHPNFNNINFELSRIIFNPKYKPEIPAADNKANRDFTKRMIKTIEESGLEKAKSEYKNRKKSEQLMEVIMRNEGFNRIDNQQPDIAIQIFEMNVYAYPKSARALQGLAEGYMETGNNEEALKYFKKSLRINPDNHFVKEMIHKLEPVPES